MLRIQNIVRKVGLYEIANINFLPQTLGTLHDDVV